MQTASKRRWWSFARAFQLLPLEQRKKVTQSRKLRSTYLRIARVHPHLGGTLDTMGAPLRVHAFVAYAPDLLALPLAASQQARFEAVVKSFEEGRRWPLPAELKGLVAGVEEKWLGRPRAPTAKLEVPAGDVGGGGAGQAKEAEFAESVAAAVALRDPEMAGMLRQLAERRRGATSTVVR